MSVSKLPSGKWRAQVWHPDLGRNVSAASVLGVKATSYPTKRDAKAAREAARLKLTAAPSALTVMDWWATWTTDALYARPKESTNIWRTERTKHFAKAHADLPLALVDDLTVARWLSGGKRNSQVDALRAMFGDATKPKAGRLLPSNPFAGLGLSKGKGNAKKQPPSEPVVWTIVEHAKRLTTPAYAAWLQVAAFTGMRPGELDALRWECVDFQRGRINVERQWNSTSHEITPPKNGQVRDAILTPPARAALLELSRESEWCFMNTRGHHMKPSSRSYHWKAVSAASGWEHTLYLATRHFAGWYMVNVLRVESEDVAFALGHEDGGELVRTLYGHRDREQSLERVARAYEQAGNVRPLRVEDKRDSA